MPWMVRHQSFLRNRFVVRSSGRNSMRRKHPQRSSHWTSVDLHVGSHSEERSTKLSIVSAPFLSTIRKEQGIFVLPDTWTTDLQNVVGSGCPSRLECEVFRRQQSVPAHTHQNSCACCPACRISESDSWRCLGNDQTCVWLGRGTR